MSSYFRCFFCGSAKGKRLAMAEAVLRSILDYYVFDVFKEYGCLAVFSSSRVNYGFDNNPHLEDNRKAFLEKLNINPRDLVSLKQTHGSGVFLADLKDRGKGALGYDSAILGQDGLITSVRRLPLAVFTADCLSIFIFDVKNKVASLIHAGWRGTKEKIVKIAIDMMKDTFSSSTNNIICGFGPCIRACCYEVGPEFKEYFNEGLFSRNDKLFLDLPYLNYKQLIDCGIKKENIFDSSVCTSCRTKDFFSYRKEGLDAGRMISVIMLE